MNRRAAASMLGAIGVTALIVFTQITGNVHAISSLRPWMFVAPLVVLVVSLLVFGLTILWRLGRGARAVIALVLIASVLSQFRYNRPTYYDTPAGPVASVRNDDLVIGNSPTTQKILGDSPAYAILPDQGVVGALLNNGPRVMGIRSFGGDDPTAQRAYMEAVNSYGRIKSNDARRLVIRANPYISWFADNGVKYFISAAGKFPRRALAGLRVIFKGKRYSVWELRNPRPLFSSAGGCLRITGYTLDANQITIGVDASSNDCTLRSTMNYSKHWRSEGSAMPIAPIRRALGFTIAHIPQGRHTIVLQYRNGAYGLGQLLFLAGLVLFIWYGLRFPREERTARPSEANPSPGVEPASS
jgi:hypothetical protein